MTSVELTETDSKSSIIKKSFSLLEKSNNSITSFPTPTTCKNNYTRLAASFPEQPG